MKKYYDFFSNNYLDRTIWYKNSLRLKHYLFPRTNLSYAYLGIFPLLNKLNEQKDKRPFFVYAHIMMPHSPFYFDENGNRQITENKNLPLKIKYLKQLIFTNKLIYSTINQILANSKTEPIIIIQGDHGFRYLEDVGSIEKNREAHSILNAYYLPYGGNKVLNDSIRPVNTFRVILNYYFGMDLPMCQDLKP